MNVVTESVLLSVADEACDNAFANGNEVFRTLRGGRYCFYPIVREDGNGEIEVGIGVNPMYHYLVYQENGFASYPMKSLYGKTVPMLIGGQVVFRKCTGINQFRSGFKTYWHRGIDGELIPEYKQARAWVHPGLPPKRFMEEALDDAIERNSDLIGIMLFTDRALEGYDEEGLKELSPEMREAVKNARKTVADARRKIDEVKEAARGISG